MSQRCLSMPPVDIRTIIENLTRRQIDERNVRLYPQGILPPNLCTRIPLEIYEAIIDYLDGLTLPSAALVCTAWYPRAMHILYHTVELRTRRGFDMLLKQSRTSRRVKQWLATTRELVASNPPVTSDLSPKERKNDRFLHALPLALGRAMSGVQVLMMKGLHGSMPYAFILALAQFESLQTLHLSSCRLSNIAHLRRIVASFPKLEELALYGEVLTTQSSGIHVGASALPESDIRLRCLTIDARGDARKFKPIIDWIVHARICTSLDELSIGWIGEPTRSIEAVDRLLRVASPSLTRYSEVANLSNWHGNLIPNTALRSLDCTLTNINPLGQSSDNWPKMVDKLRSILSTVRSRQLEHIGLSSGVMLYDSAYGELGIVVEKLDLRHLHEVMSRAYFDALREVKMKTLLYDSHKRSAADVDDIGRKIEVVFRTLLRPWSDRGIVEVSWTQ